MVPLAASSEGVAVAPGVAYFPAYLDRAGQEALRDEIGAVLAEAPLFRPRMPRTGKPFSVRMSNCGPLGWVSDESGYRYQPTHPETGRAVAADAEGSARTSGRRLAPGAPPPEACLINFYDAGARDGPAPGPGREELSAPVVSLSLGDAALLPARRGRAGATRPARSASNRETRSIFGGPARLAFHGVDRIVPGSSALLRTAAAST